MYTLIFARNFVVSAEKLQKRWKQKLKEHLKILSEEPFHPLLHAKPLAGKLLGLYSFRLGRDYRVIFQFKEEKMIVLLRMKPRDQVYKT